MKSIDPFANFRYFHENAHFMILGSGIIEIPLPFHYSCIPAAGNRKCAKMGNGNMKTFYFHKFYNKT